MPSIQIKDVPEDTHAVLRQRASAAHQSLQEYLRSKLIARLPGRRSMRSSTAPAGGPAGPHRCATRFPRRGSTVLVIDASVLAVALVDDGPDGDQVRDRLRGESLAAPSLIDLEVLSVWRGLTRRGHLEARRADLALADLQAIPMQRVDHTALLWRCWELRDNLTMYDAACVALAEALQVLMLTGDQRLARASGPNCPVEVIKAKPHRPDLP